MIKPSLRTFAAGFGSLVLVCAASAAQAQDTNTVTTPQVRDFELPGTRTTPLPQANEQQPAPTPTPTPAPAAEPPAAETPAAETPAATPPAAEREPAPPRERNVQRETAREETRGEEAAEVPAGVPAPAELEQALPSAAPPAAVPAPRTEWGPVVPLETAEQPFPWLYVGLGLTALLALLAFLFMRRRKAATAGAHEEFAIAEPEAPQPAAAEPDPLFARRAAQPAPAAPPPPVPRAPAPASFPAVAQEGGVVGISLRPRLELEFRPDRAAATLTETSVQFELVIRNVGNRTARDIRVQARMFNAGAEQDREISEFYAAPVSKDEPPAIAGIPPRGETQFKGTVTLPKEQVREIIIQGRRLFIPMVAFNVVYEWEGGRTGQTSMSYLVGREAPTPQEKMGGFRLDLGPRLYRQVGQRQASLAKVV